MIKVIRRLLLFVFLLPRVVYSQGLPEYTVTVATAGSTSYYFCGLTKVNMKAPDFLWSHVIFDKTGHVVYHKIFPKGQLTVDLKLHANGKMTYYLNNKYFVMDSTFTVIDSLSPLNGIMPDSHEILLLPNGNYLLLGSELLKPTEILKLHAGTRKANFRIRRSIKCGVLQEQDAQKKVVFEWHSKSYYDLSEIDPKILQDSTVFDWTHFNSVERDRDGNYLVSLRYFHEITKISRRDSSIIWRMGGGHNQFKFVNDKVPFKGQHNIRQLANGNLTLFDNGWMDSVYHPARALEYRINEAARTATLVWAYTDHPVACSKYAGSMQRLKNGNTIINYGLSLKSRTLFNVLDGKGKKVLEVVFKDTLGSYRVYAYDALPWRLPTPNITPLYNEGNLILDAGSGYRAYKWSTGATTQSTTIRKKGLYSVSAQLPSGGWVTQKMDIEEKDLRREKKRSTK